jgi:hypothetical protein
LNAAVVQEADDEIVKKNSPRPNHQPGVQQP